MNKPEWTKSSFSAPNQNCVEVRPTEDGGRQVRDSKLGEASPVLDFTADEWTAFKLGVGAGEL